VFLSDLVTAWLFTLIAPLISPNDNSYSPSSILVSYFLTTCCLTLLYTFSRKVQLFLEKFLI